MPQITPLVTEYRAYAAGYLLVGLGGVAIDATVRDEPGRSVGSAAIMAVVVAIVLGVSNLRWLTSAVRSAPEAPRSTEREPTRETMRRIALELLLVAVLATAGLAGGPSVGAIIAGIAIGTGVVNLAGWLWLRRTERNRRVTLFREAPPRLIALGRRPITTRPA